MDEPVIRITMGRSQPTLSEQLRALGLPFNAQWVQELETDVQYTESLRLRGIVTAREREAMLKRIGQKAIHHVTTSKAIANQH
jgi:hypothetical protein